MSPAMLCALTLLLALIAAPPAWAQSARSCDYAREFEVVDGFDACFEKTYAEAYSEDRCRAATKP